MRNLLACTATLILAFSSPASAAWNVAQSRHFVIYANESSGQLSDFANKLERFDQAARLAMRMDDPDQGKGNRLKIFVLSTPQDVRSVIGDKTGWIAGAYTGRVSGSLAYVPRSLDNPRVDPDDIFFHEYTHHLMMQALDRPYPEWYVEGFAEFLSTAKVDRDGSVEFGAPLNNRAYAILDGPQMSFEELAGGITPRMSNDDRNGFYARSWLLAHYLQMSDKRKGQLNLYLQALSDGKAPLAAAQQVFGDLKQLDKELNAYRTQRFVGVKILGTHIQPGPVQVQPLSAGASQVIPLLAKIEYAPRSPEAEQLAAKVRLIEARYPGDDLVEKTLAQAELDSGHPQAAEAAASRALKANPADTAAMVSEGRAIEDEAASTTGDARKAAFERARGEFVAANKLDTEDPNALFEFFRSFVKEGLRPTANAIAALHYASDLAPQDLSVRMNSGIAYLREGKPKDARATLAVVAYSPHQNPAQDIAKRMISDIDAGTPNAALMELRAAVRQTAGAN